MLGISKQNVHFFIPLSRPNRAAINVAQNTFERDSFPSLRTIRGRKLAKLPQSISTVSTFFETLFRWFGLDESGEGIGEADLEP